MYPCIIITNICALVGGPLPTPRYIAFVSTVAVYAVKYVIGSGHPMATMPTKVVLLGICFVVIRFAIC